MSDARRPDEKPPEKSEEPPERPTPQMEADEELIGRSIVGGGAPEDS